MRILSEETSTKQILGRLVFLNVQLNATFRVVKNSGCLLFNLLRRGTHLFNLRKNMRGMQSLYLFNKCPFILSQSQRLHLKYVRYAKQPL